MVFQNNVLSGAGGSGTAVYQIDQSIRFPRTNNTTGGGYMSRTFGSAGDRTSWTWSCWFKLGTLNNFAAGSGLYYQFFACDNGTNDSNRGSFHIIADTSVSSNIQFQFQGHSTQFLRTNRQFRDPSAWMHLVLVWDSDNAIASERARLYINGQRETSFADSSNPTSGQEIGINLNATHRLGISYNIAGGSVNYPFDGYMAEIHFLDGYSYGPEFFGETTSNNLWIPKEYTGSYGSNGFKIDGRDASDLGDDESGNGNDFTTSGLAAHDQVFDTPTNNFCVMNAIENVPCNFSEGNLTLDSTANFSGNAMRGTIHIKGGSTGKWYYEVVGSLTGDYFSTGWMLSSIITPSSTVIGQDTGSVAFYNTGSYQNGSNAQHVITKPAAGDVIGVGLDASTGQVFLRDDSGYFVGTLSSNALSSGVVITGFSGEDLVMASRNSSSGTCTYNFGQDGTFAGAKTAQGNTDANGIGNFFYTVPDGFLAICTKNLGS
jgi:hypothetical protein